MKLLKDLLDHATTSLRLTGMTLLLCSVAYPLVVLVMGQVITPQRANGSLLKGPGGDIVGSELIAQPFTRPEYLWPRPSAAGYDGAGAGGSNLGPTNPALRERARATLKAYGNGGGKPVPADLVAASGSGLDPHITLRAALFQAGRIADARGLSKKAVEELMAKNSFTPGWVFVNEPLLNVLKVNIALDGLKKKGFQPYAQHTR